MYPTGAGRVVQGSSGEQQVAEQQDVNAPAQGGPEVAAEHVATSQSLEGHKLSLLLPHKVCTPKCMLNRCRPAHATVRILTANQFGCLRTSCKPLTCADVRGLATCNEAGWRSTCCQPLYLKH
jgi:hypothetical protein